MRKWLVFTLLFVLVVCPSNAGAQSGTELKSVNIELWSEYDQPSMLVIQQFEVAEGTPLPVNVTLRFPKNGNLIGVAFDSSGNLINAQFTGPEKQGNWQTVTVNVQSYDPHRVEYYQPLTRDGDQRQFAVKWFGDYPVGGINVNLLIPSDSTNVTTKPALSGMETSTNGSYLTGSLSRGALKAGESYEFEVQYRRASEAIANPSPADSVQPSEPIGPETSGRVSVDKMPWVIGGVGLALIAIALFTYWRSTQSEGRPSANTGSRRRRRQQGEDDDGQAYCHECGARAHAGDRFCRTCGSRLRVE